MLCPAPLSRGVSDVATGPPEPRGPSAREQPGIKRNRGPPLKEQVKRKFKAPLLIITV